MPATAPLLEVQDVHKRFGEVRANQGVSFAVQAGTLHALIGENGAGKSTIINILYGLTKPDSGQVKWQGEPIKIKKPSQARQLGINVVFQKFSLFEPLTVFENIALAVDLPKAVLADKIATLGQKYRLQINQHQRVDELSAGEKQRIEIIRCLLQNPKLLIMDEPTSVLTPIEVDKLFVLLRLLAEDGCAIIFVSHKLKEVMALCSHVTVLRQGKTVGQSAIEDIDQQDMVSLMVGEGGGDFSLDKSDRETDGEVVMAVSKMKLPIGTLMLDIDKLHLKKSVITGVAGVAGNGQEQLLQALNGECCCAAADVVLSGQGIGDWGVEARLRSGVLSVPTDRYHTASVGSLSLVDNTLLGVMQVENYTGHGVLKKGQMQAVAEQIIAEFNVSTPAASQKAFSLSGGNLQKFIIGRAILQSPKVLILANPTWGVDVHSAYFIRQQLVKLAASGTAILVISEDLDELFEIADEIAVIRQGIVEAPMAVTAQLSRLDVGEKMVSD